MGLKSFLRQSALPVENKKVVVSKRFVGEDGAPEQWELRAVRESENARIKDECTKKVISKGGRMTANFDSSLYNLKLCTASVAYPDLKDAELQASYGVVGEEALLVAMLISGEYSNLMTAVTEICGFDSEQMEEQKDEVKNS